MQPATTRRWALPAGLVLRHFEDGVDGLLLGFIDKGAGVHHQDVGGFGVGGDGGSGLGEKTHHHFAIDQVFGAAQADKSDPGTRNLLPWDGWGWVDFKTVHTFYSINLNTESQAAAPASDHFDVGRWSGRSANATSQ